MKLQQPYKNQTKTNYKHIYLKSAIKNDIEKQKIFIQKKMENEMYKKKEKRVMTERVNLETSQPNSLPNLTLK